MKKDSFLLYKCFYSLSLLLCFYSAFFTDVEFEKTYLRASFNKNQNFSHFFLKKSEKKLENEEIIQIFDRFNSQIGNLYILKQFFFKNGNYPVNWSKTYWQKINPYSKISLNLTDNARTSIPISYSITKKTSKTFKVFAYTYYVGGKSFGQFNSALIYKTALCFIGKNYPCFNVWIELTIAEKDLLIIPSIISGILSQLNYS